MIIFENGQRFKLVGERTAMVTPKGRQTARQALSA